MLDSSGKLVTPDGEPLFDADLKLTIQPNWTNPVGGRVSRHSTDRSGTSGPRLGRGPGASGGRPQGRGSCQPP